MGIDFIMKDNTNLHHVIYTSQEIHHISKTISQCNVKHPVFFTRTDPLFEYIYAHPDDHFIIIFYSELNQKDYKLIKDISVKENFGKQEKKKENNASDTIGEYIDYEEID